jgi:TolA-binding protein/predicted Ser/Thr protein kinase
MIGKTIAHYRIVDQLGAGGMGVVYKAEDLRLGRSVALKFLPPELSRDAAAVERFEREARTASALNHPNICTIFSIDEFEGQRFIAMELLDGQSLSAAIAGKPMPVERILELGIQISDALDAAHAQNILHRDIKPANIFITRRGQAKVLDFGLAKLASAPAGFHDTGEDSPTMAGLLMSAQGIALGTVAYMSPEQARGEVLDARSDLFSFGIVLYEMATGVQAFPGQTSAVVFDSILNRMPAPIASVRPDIPAQLDQIITKALEKDRSLRYQTASDMHADLRRLKRDRDSGRMQVSGAVPLSGGVATASGAQAVPGAPSGQASPPATAAAAASGAKGRKRTGLLVGGVVAVLLVGGVVAALVVRGSTSSGASADPLTMPAAEAQAAPESIELVDPAEGLLPESPESAEQTEPPVPAATNAPVPVPPAAERRPAVKPAERGDRRNGIEAAAARAAVEAPVVPEVAEASPVRPDPAVALLGVAQAKAAARLFDQAAADLQTLVRDHPASTTAPAALLTLAGIRQQQSRPEDALAAYVEVRSRYRDSPAAAEAGVRYAQLLLQTNRGDRIRVARDTYAAVARDYPSSVWAPRALSLKAELEQREKLKENDAAAGGQVPSALVTWRALVEHYPDAPESEDALWNLANGYEDLRRYDYAAQTFAVLATKFPKTGHDAWWRAAEIYDRRLRDKEAAKNAYARVPTRSRNYKEAQKRIQ